MEVALFLLSALLLPLVLAEFSDWSPWLARRMVLRALRIIPAEKRDRYEKEWLAELDWLKGKGKLSALFFAIGVYITASRTGRVASRRAEGTSSDPGDLRHGRRAVPAKDLTIAAEVEGALQSADWEERRKQQAQDELDGLRRTLATIMLGALPGLSEVAQLQFRSIMHDISHEVPRHLFFAGEETGRAKKRRIRALKGLLRRYRDQYYVGASPHSRQTRFAESSRKLLEGMEVVANKLYQATGDPKYLNIQDGIRRYLDDKDGKSLHARIQFFLLVAEIW